MARDSRAARRLGAALLVLAAGALPGARSGAPPSPPAAQERGAMLYREHCARCHGEDARGEGPEAAQLQFRPADLTGLRRRAGGQFPAERVARTIDGRRPLPGHGGTDMPVWGDVMKDSRERYDEAAVRARITSIVKYLETVQEPARR